MPITALPNVSAKFVDITVDPLGGGGGSGTVTSVDVSGGTTGLTTTGGPIGGAGVITIQGILGIANGGTGTSLPVAAGYVKSTGAAFTNQTTPIPVTDGGTGTTTTFTNKNVIFTGAAGAYTQDAGGNFVYDPVNKNLGVSQGFSTQDIGNVNTALATFSVDDGSTVHALDTQAGNANQVRTRLINYAGLSAGVGAQAPGTSELLVTGAGAAPRSIALATQDGAGNIRFYVGGETDGSLTASATNTAWNFKNAVSVKQQLYTPFVTLSLNSGLNSSIVLPAGSYFRASGPGAAFSIGGFTNPSDGQRIIVYNSTSQTMTIVNEDLGTTTPSQRIKTTSGLNVVLSANSPSIAEFIYDVTDARWILDDIGASTGFVRQDGTTPLTADWPAGQFNILSKNSQAIFNVVSGYGADPTGGNSAATTTAFNNAIAAAIAAKGRVYVPTGTYNLNANLVVQNATGFEMFGDGEDASIISGINNGITLDINGNAGSGSVREVVIRGLRFTVPGASGIGLRIWNCLHFTVANCAVFSGGAGSGLSIQGSGNGVINNVQATSGAGAALNIGNGGGTLTSSGPLVIIGGQFSQPTGGSPAVILSGDYLGVSFLGTMFEANGGTQASTVQIDGGTSTLSAVNFYDCHGESNYNTTNTGVDFLVGSITKAGHVGFYGGNYFGQGNGTNFQAAWLKVVAAKSVVVDGVIASKLASAHGYDTAMVRLEATFPVAGDVYSFRQLDKDTVTGPLYSSAGITIGSTYLGDLQSNATNIGPALVGAWPVSPTISFLGTSALDQTAAGNYALLQLATGGTVLNSATGQTLDARINNSTAFEIDSTKKIWSAEGTATVQTAQLGGALFTQTANSVTTANSLTTLLGTGSGSLTLPANLLIAGRTIRLTLRGYVSAADGGVGTHTLTLLLGGVSVATGTSGATFQTVLNAGWEATADITCRTTGAGGTVIGGAKWLTEIATATPDGIVAGPTSQTTAACNTTGTLVVDLQFNNGNATGTITTTNAAVEVLN